jgi:hypothetical protein
MICGEALESGELGWNGLDFDLAGVVGGYCASQQRRFVITKQAEIGQLFYLRHVFHGCRVPARGRTALNRIGKPFTKCSVCDIVGG